VKKLQEYYKANRHNGTSLRKSLNEKKCGRSFLLTRCGLIFNRRFTLSQLPTEKTC